MEESIEEIEPNKLIVKNNDLGFEKISGFEQVTNFNSEVCGYVGDGEGNVVGYIVRVILAVQDPLQTKNRPSK